MKKITILVAMIYLLVCLGGCMPEEPQETAESTLPTVSVEIPTPIASPESTTMPAVKPSDIALSSISTPIAEEFFFSKDGALLLEYTSQNVFLIHQDGAVADSVQLKIMNEMDHYIDMQDVLLMAQEAYAQNPTDWVPYAYKVLFSTMRIDQSIVSIYGSISQSTSEDSTSMVSSTYSLINGQKISYQDIQGPGFSAHKLLEKIVQRLTTSAASQQLFSTYQADISSQLRSDCNNWFFSENGLCFYYSPMEIASEAAGTILVEIPYPELTGIIKDDYLPAEEYITGGIMKAQLSSEADFSKFQSYAEVIQDSFGEQFLLSTDGAVTDVRIEMGAWDENGIVFTPTATIFACDGMSSSSAVVVQFSFPDVLPGLRLQYTSEGVHYTKYLFQSGKDGSILLTD